MKEAAVYVHEGFLGQRLRVIPRPAVRAAQSQPIVRRLLVTDVGYFPRAAQHGRVRATGAPETIVMVCTDGVGWVEWGDRDPVRVERGSAVVLAPGVRHRYRADDDDPWTIWWAHVTGSDVDDFLATIVADGRGPIVELHDVYAVVQSLDEALSALEKDETLPMLLTAAGAAWRMLAAITSSALRGTAATSDRIRQVQDYLRTNLDTDFSVPELAAMAGLSPSHFSALFRGAVGTSVKDYLKRLRSARARELLITTDSPISEVALVVGYDDALYFSRQFRSINGVSPTEFRRQAAAERVARA
ncbi:helix-turn-helix domain-containing protein [Microbacterium phyllosphaerae]|uniref:AraC family transcriptional regulator n=1 Tax=Microbacterium phyllosphaerae TaxID=124798 RepID=UPI003D6551D4